MIAKHNYLLHKTQDKILTEQEFEDIPQEYERQIINGPNSSKQENFIKRKEERKKEKER